MLGRDDLAALGLQGLPDIPHDERIWDYTVRSTSGTTGGTPVLVARHVPKDPRLLADTDRKLSAGGTLGHRGTLVSMFFYAHRSDKKDASIASIGVGDLQPSLKAALEEYNPDSLWGVVSFVLKLFSHVRNIQLPTLRRVTWGGEYVSDQSVEIVRGLFPKIKIESWYGCAELGNLVLPQCPYQSRFEFHPLAGVEVTIDSPDEKGEGALLFSTALTDNAYVKDYRPGEVGSILKEPCKCGEQITFMVGGRIDFDIIRLAGAILHVEECERAMRDLALYIADFQIVASEHFENGAPRGEVDLRITPTKELLQMPLPETFIKNEFERRFFVTPSKTLGALVAEGIFRPSKVTFMSEIQHGTKKVRLKRAP